ncbi:MAG: L,D-transpeptidase [Aestuariivirga sp.]
MKQLSAVFAVFFLLLQPAAGPASASSAAPEVEININISSQSMAVNVNGWPYGRWKVSTARDGYHTPRGRYRPFALRRVYYSKKYDNSPMPNSIFFYGGYAIHGTYYVKNLGRPASHGCVRLSPENAAKLFNLVQQHGLGATRVSITD